MTRPTRRTFPLIATLAAVTLVGGCGDGGGAGTTAVPPVAVPLSERVVQGGDLAGFTPSAAERLDLAAIAAENGVTVARLRERGIRRAAVARLAGPPDAFGISAAAELETADDARAEAARLFRENGSSEPGLTATPIAIPDIPGAAAARKSGRRDGREYLAIEVTWADGTVAHELFVLARAADLREADVLAAARAVSARSRGASLPAAP